MDIEFERIYKIASEFSLLLCEKYGYKYLNIYRKSIKKSKHWKNFVTLDNWASEGKIKLPEYLKVQINSGHWDNTRLYPFHLVTERAVAIWEKYCENNKFVNKNNLVDDNEIFFIISNKIKKEIKDEKYFSSFIIDGKFNFQKYFILKYITGDIIYKILFSKDIDEIRIFFNNDLKKERDLATNKLKDIDFSDMSKGEKKIHTEKINVFLSNYQNLIESVLEERRKA